MVSILKVQLSFMARYAAEACPPMLYIQSTYLMLLSSVFLSTLPRPQFRGLRERLELHGATLHQGKEAVIIDGARIELET